MTVGGRVMGADDSEGEKWMGKWGGGGGGARDDSEGEEWMSRQTVKGRSGWVGGGQR